MKFETIEKTIKEYKCLYCKKINSEMYCKCKCSYKFWEDYSKCDMQQHIKITRYRDQWFEYEVMKYWKCVKCNQIWFKDNRKFDTQSLFIKNKRSPILFKIFDLMTNESKKEIE